MNSEILFQYSPWFLLVCVLVGMGYALLLYQKKYNFTRNQQILLGITRSITVSVICFLLLNPLFKREELKIIPPTVVVAVDNSASLNKLDTKNIKQKIRDLAGIIRNSDINVVFRSLSNREDLSDETVGLLNFKEKSTNLSELLNGLSTDFEGQNLTDVILLTDGIQNAGISPAYNTYPFRVHTVGVGDTTKKKDIRLIGVFANQVAYMGNTFPIEAEINAFNFAGRQTTVLLKRGDTIIDRKVISFGSEDEVKRVSFTTKETKEGIQRYRIEVLPLDGEVTTRNNRQDTYIEIIDGKEKILLLAMAPHPDVKALRAIIEKNELYELTVKMNSSDNFSDLSTIDFDILILHQFPDKGGSGRQFLPKLLSRNKPTIFILGNESDVLSFNGMQQALGINPQGNKTDKVTASLNTSFKRYNLSPQQMEILQKFPEMTVPFGEYRLGANSDVILWQQVGSIKTEKPLLVVNTSVSRKTAVIAGEGIWRWRMEEYDLTENQAIVDDIISKTIQLISVKDDKRKLRVYPSAPTYGVDEQIVFENEIYNNIYERIYNQDITLDIYNELGVKKSFNYTITDGQSSYTVSNLAAGVYRFKASSKVLGKIETAEGQFVVTDLSLEDQNMTADFELLRTLSQQNNGKFVELKNIANLENFLSENKSPGKALSSESIDEIISLRWLLVILLLLTTFEWAVRKYLGTY